MQNTSGTYAKALLFVFIGGLIGWQANVNFGNPSEADEVDNAEKSGELSMDLFWNVWDMVEANYVDIEHVDDQQQIYGAVSGMVDALGDPYSVFMTPEETDQFQSSLDGELQGIGAELTVKDGKLVIVSPLKDSPAEEAGLLPGDYIYMVFDTELNDWVSTGEITLWEAIMLIRGEPGTEAKLKILRENSEDPIEFTIIRQEIDVPSVELTFVERGDMNLAHLSIYQFGDDTLTEFEEAVREVLLANADGMVLDMRLNGGGYLDVSIEIMSEFFDDERTGVIVKRRNMEDQIIQTTGSGQLKDLPMVVLIDEGSASASEILAGALQDYARATLMGEQSFGKGSVQELTDLSDGSSLRLTIAKWYTPNDRSIDDTGIAPDITVSMEASDIDTENDVQLDAALDYLLKL
ncbi:MAG: S41 family peptidase [Candidatus Gracilibacteria bacterium]